MKSRICHEKQLAKTIMMLLLWRRCCFTGVISILQPKQLGEQGSILGIAPHHLSVMTRSNGLSCIFFTSVILALGAKKPQLG